MRRIALRLSKNTDESINSPSIFGRGEELKMNICPIPSRWNEIYKKLLSACKEKRTTSAPPVPLILDGWVYSNDEQKAETWRATESWARENGLAEHIVVPAGEWYAVEYPCSGAVGPFGGPMHLPWKYEPEAIPSDENVRAALTRLTETWGEVAGELSEYTRPHMITGAKARRLVVLLSPSAPPPPWGDWKKLPLDESRRTFTKLRRAINTAIAPLEIDHIEFEAVDANAASQNK